MVSPSVRKSPWEIWASVRELRNAHVCNASIMTQDSEVVKKCPAMGQSEGYGLQTVHKQAKMILGFSP